MIKSVITRPICVFNASSGCHFGKRQIQTVLSPVSRSHSTSWTQKARQVGVKDGSAAEAQALQDSITIDERVQEIGSLRELQRELSAAGDRLVILELMADGVCETGLFEPDEGWSPDMHKKEEAKLEVCTGIKHKFMRMAADSPNVRFLECMQEEDVDTELARFVGVERFPTVAFFKNNELLWKSDGSHTMSGDVQEGLLYFNERTSTGLEVSEHVRELTNAEEAEAFMSGRDSPSELQLIMVTTHMCTPCIHVYPSVVTLAINFAGLIDFARMEDFEDDEDQNESSGINRMFAKLNILEVPTFICLHKGKEVGRSVSSHRGDLIGFVLQQSVKYGIQPPSPKRV